MLVTRLRLTPLIVTLGTLYAYGGLALALTGGSPLRGIPAALAPFGGAACSAPSPSASSAACSSMLLPSSR